MYAGYFFIRASKGLMGLRATKSTKVLKTRLEIKELVDINWLNRNRQASWREGEQGVGHENANGGK